MIHVSTLHTNIFVYIFTTNNHFFIGFYIAIFTSATLLAHRRGRVGKVHEESTLPLGGSKIRERRDIILLGISWMTIPKQSANLEPQTFQLIYLSGSTSSVTVPNLQVRLQEEGMTQYFFSFSLRLKQNSPRENLLDVNSTGQKHYFRNSRQHGNATEKKHTLFTSPKYVQVQNPLSISFGLRESHENHTTPRSVFKAKSSSFIPTSLELTCPHISELRTLLKGQQFCVISLENAENHENLMTTFAWQTLVPMTVGQFLSRSPKNHQYTILDAAFFLFDFALISLFLLQACHLMKLTPIGAGTPKD